MKKTAGKCINILLTLILVSLICFALSSFAKGDAAIYVLGEEASEEALMELRAELGLDRGFFVRWGIFLKNFFTLNWPENMAGESILKIVSNRAGVTLELTFFSLVLAIGFSILISLFSWKKNGKGDVITEVLSLVIFSMPAFLLAVLLMVLFSYVIPLFPVSGYVKPSISISRNIMSMVLPSVSMALMHSALFVRVLKRSIRREMGMPYMDGALARGKERWKLPFEEALRPASVSFMGLIANSVSSLILGSAVTETVFNLPGLGSLIVTSSLRRDIDTVTTVIMLFSVIIAAVSILSELLIRAVDPRAGRSA